MWRYLAALIVASSLCTGAQAEPLSFKGLPLGATKDELLAKFPSLKCEKPMRSFMTLGEEHCVCYAANCADRSLYSYADRPAWGASFSIVGGRAEAFRITIRPESYDAVRNALQSVYGRGAEKQRQLTTGGGMSLVSRTWEAVTTPDGTVNVLEHASRIDEGAAGGSSKAYLDYVQRIQQGDPATGRKDM